MYLVIDADGLPKFTSNEHVAKQFIECEDFTVLEIKVIKALDYSIAISWLINDRRIAPEEIK